MAPTSGSASRSRGRGRSTQSGSPSSPSSTLNTQVDAQPPSLVETFPFTFEYSLRSATTSVRIEADEDPFPDDVSITESISAYRVENGRTYHAYRDGSYAYPNDEMELSRYEWVNVCLKHLFGGKIYFSPLSSRNPPRRILDIATGTGNWAIEMSDEFPDAEIIGTDLSPVQPTFVPENVHFYIEDALEDWVYPHLMDYIHVRMTVGVWHDFERDCARKAFDNLEPGGWFEAQDLMPAMHCDDGTMPDDWPLKRLFEDLHECAEHLGRSLWVVGTYKEAMINAGFVDVQQITYKLPMNNWPRERKWKEMGAMWKGVYSENGGLQAFAIGLLHRVRGLTREQVELHLVDSRKALNDTNVHAYERFHVVMGRKPFPNEVSLRPQETSGDATMADP